MYVEQTLKVEKASILDFFKKGRVFKIRIKNIYFFLFGLFRFSIKQHQLNLKKQTEFKLEDEENQTHYLTECSERKAILRIEICSKKMNKLLVERQICASDVRCLDINSKQCLKKLCLKTCL